jgi:hypothetical protein
MLTGNKGEWSEIYALLKVISDGKIYAGDQELNKLEDVFYPIIKILRTESGGNYEYKIEGDLVLIYGNGDEIKVPIDVFTEQAKKLYAEILKAEGSFRLDETEAFMKSIYCNQLKAPASNKTDIQIEVHDPRINQIQNLGFSIKSKLGEDSTLLNAGKTTNFTYKIKNISLDNLEIKTINSIASKSKIKDRIEIINNKGGELTFEKIDNDVFSSNLVLIDSLLPEILASLVLKFYTSKLSKVKDLTNKIQNNNPLKYNTIHAHNFYEYKVKRLLTDIALGMMPSKVWNGQYEANGGYLIIKENGDVVCYHIYNKNLFEDYLYGNTKLETASSSRHEFGNIYSENGELYIKLNLQVRFM